MPLNGLPSSDLQPRSDHSGDLPLSFFAKLFGIQPDPKEALRPLWNAVVAEARSPLWYREYSATDTVEGRFDMITSVMSIVMLRLEAEPRLIPASARLTELFVDDMDAQLRETGLGDPTLGKKMGKLMEALGGRIGAFRVALGKGETEMAAAVERNARLNEGASPVPMANALIALAQRLAVLPEEQLLKGKFTA